MKTRFALAIVFCLSGCAADRGLRPGVSGEGEVRAAFGAPALSLATDDGARILAYPSGPYGTQTFIARIGPDGRLMALHQALNDETFHAIQPGMRRDDVLRLIGPPGDSMRFPRSRTEAWDYRYQDTWGYTAIFSVTFDEAGVVVSKLTRRLERDFRRF